MIAVLKFGNPACRGLRAGAAQLFARRLRRHARMPGRPELNARLSPSCLHARMRLSAPVRHIINHRQVFWTA
eukprot:4791040-Pleurochrysis_carterae.AAC.1